MQRILVIDDDDSVRDLLESLLTENGFDVATASNGEKGIELLQHEKFDLFLVDLMMPGIGGLDVLKEASSHNITIPSIVVTAYATVKTAVEAMKLGAFDYVTKPFMVEELLIVVKRALNVSKLQKENIMLKKQLQKKYDFHRLIGSSPQMQKVYEMIEKIADTDSTVLISGESGTGKELVAKTIHYNSSRSQNAFVPLNCAAIPKDLLESELFGHEKGAFTGAVNTRIGRFELATGGTIFLDEIGELHPSLQVKLLRVLQEREFERVGGTKTIKADVRVLAATNKDLEKATQDGSFREDLYYRLNVIPLQIPPLRERKEDIALLIEHFLSIFSKKKKREPLKVSAEVMGCLLNYNWPGNVRELENLIERLVILTDANVINVSDLPDRFFQARDPFIAKTLSPLSSGKVLLPEGGVDLNDLLNDIEKSLINQAMQKAGGVKSRAASILGLNRTTLIEKLKKKAISISASETNPS
ncbi:MAG: sigma-54-dependent Fis family transcriptional regulator [Nitrospirae bacterium]|nr:sigma-54-dependent Fis family transcriptional regulator [Nitrospirota bacterium]